MEHNDQPQGVEDLALMLGDEDSEEVVEETTEEEQPEEQVEAESEQEEEPQQEAELYKITVKNDRGEDEEKELTLEQLAEGYMLSSDYTRKRQQESAQVRQAEQQYAQAIMATQKQSVEQIEQLKAFVIQNALPELQQLTPQLAEQDPAEFVRLQAKQTQLMSTINQLEQQKQAHAQHAEQAEIQYRNQLIEQQKSYVIENIPEFSSPEYKTNLMTFVESTYGIPQSDLAYLASAPMFKDGNVLDSGRVLQVLNDAMKYRQMQQAKPMVQKKVSVAPKVIRPAAPKPKSNNLVEAKKRLARTGRIEDLAAFL